VNVPKDTKIDANTFIVFIASCTACKTVLEDGISYSQAFFVKFFVKFVINSMSQIQNVQPNLANIIEATALVPENDRICSDCPHATAILIMASYVDDNLTFTNCAALAAEFEVHCNVKFLINAQGPVNWYLSVKYDRDPNTGAVSAHQHLYIDKLLKKWGMEQCNPLPTPFPQKADEIVKELAEPVAIHDEKLVKEYQALVGSFLYLQVHTFPEISWAVSVLSKYMIRPGPAHLVIAKKLLRYLKGRKTVTLLWCAQELHRRTPARHNLWICRRILCRHNPTSTLISRIHLHAQRSCSLLARE